MLGEIADFGPRFLPFFIAQAEPIADGHPSFLRRQPSCLSLNFGLEFGGVFVQLNEAQSNELAILRGHAFHHFNETAHAGQFLGGGTEKFVEEAEFFSQFGHIWEAGGRGCWLLGKYLRGKRGRGSSGRWAGGGTRSQCHQWYAAAQYHGQVKQWGTPEEAGCPEA